MGRKDGSIYLRNLAKSGGSVGSPIKARRDSTNHPIQIKTDSIDLFSLISKRLHLIKTSPREIDT